MNIIKWRTNETEENFTRDENLLSNKTKVKYKITNSDNIPIDEIFVQQLQFRTKRNEKMKNNEQFIIKINPFEIKTFVVKFDSQ